MKQTHARIASLTVILIILMCNENLKAQITVNQSLNGQVIYSCSDFVIDSGGQGGPGYGNNENVVFTICPDNLDYRTTVGFSLFALSTVDTNPNPNESNSDVMILFDGSSNLAPIIGSYGANQLQGSSVQSTEQNTSGCLTLQFISNDSGTGSFVITVDCINPNAGCTDSSACNYNALANEENGSCLYPTQSFLNCEGNCLHDINSDGICDEIQYSGVNTIPQAISYQAAVRNAQGDPLSNQTIQVRLRISQDSISGNSEYVETHEVSTNNLGLFSLFIGMGSPIEGGFQDIEWTQGHKFLSVEFSTGSGYQLIGAQQFISVPYAQHSRTSATIKNQNLPVFENNSEAIIGGLTSGDLYRTLNGDLKIVF